MENIDRMKEEIKAVIDTLKPGAVVHIARGGRYEGWTDMYTVQPAETPYEKARRLWEEWEHEPDGGITYEAACQIVPPLLAEIDRIKSEMWTEKEAQAYGGYCYGQGEEGKIYFLARSWIQTRRAAKAKE